MTADLDPKTKAIVEILNREIDAIHVANKLYWEQGQAPTVAERAEYHRRLERLEQIRHHFTGLLGHAPVVVATLGDRSGKPPS